ncbi:MAG: hypothetical protein KKA70_14810 [Proteobacteria bacterium]|nr:hypothetical protein [Pseudomonadota bacterium]
MYSTCYSFVRRTLCKGGSEVKKHAQILDSSQWLSPEETEQIQFEKIKHLVSYAYENVPFYREKYKQENIHPKDIQTIRDFQRLPFLTRDDVNNNYDRLVSKEYSKKTSVDHTGGSTGHAMRFLMDSSTAYWSYAVEARNRGWYGVREGDKRAWVWGAIKDFPSWRLKDRMVAHIKRYRYLNSNDMTYQKMKDFADMLVQWKPVMFRAYPTALTIFANFLKENQYAGIMPTLIETCAEKVTSSQRQLFQEVFKSKVADCYSSWEIYDIAYECPDRGLHVNEDRYLELVNNGQAVEPGNVGEVVVTALTQYAFPFIRYKNEDLGVYAAKKCSCGRGMPVLQEILGRTIDVLVKPDGSIIHWSSIYIVFRHKTDILKYQVYQPDREHLEVRLVCANTFDKSLIESIHKELQGYFGTSINIKIHIVENIELTSSGKHRYIISDVAPKLTNVESITV